MTKPVRWDAADSFVLERWAQAKDLSAAFRKTKVKMRRQLKRVTSDVSSSLQSQGYQVFPEIEWAELKAFKPEWCATNDEPMVVWAVGAVYPTGYFNVAEPAAYACLYLEGFSDDPGPHRAFADALFEQLGGLPAGFQDRTADPDWTCPLWIAIDDTDDRARAALALNAKNFKQFALQRFQELFQFSDAVTTAVRPFLSR